MRVSIALLIALAALAVSAQVSPTSRSTIQRSSTVVVKDLPAAEEFPIQKIFPAPQSFEDNVVSGLRPTPKNLFDVSVPTGVPAGTSVVQNGQGPNVTTSVPPDPNCAVGTNHLLMVINSSFMIVNKSDGSIATPLTSLDTFFTNEIQQVGYNNLSPTFDPKCVYDHFSNRYIMMIVAMESPRAHSFIAFSQTDDPTGAWNNYVVQNNVGNSAIWLDYPSIGIDDDLLVVSGNMFAFAGGYQFAKLLVLDKNAGNAGLPLNAVEFENFTDGQGRIPFTLQPCNEMAAAPDFYLLSTLLTGSDIAVWQISGGLPNPVLDDTILPTETYASTTSVPQLGSTSGTQTVGHRLFNGVRNGDHLFAGRATATNSGVGSWARIFDVDLAASGNAVTEYTLGADNVYYTFPVVQPSEDGTLVVAGSRHGDDIFPSSVVIGLHNDGVFEQELIYWEGESAYSDFTTAPHRWGDYSGIGWDASVPSDVWVLTEYSGPPGGGTNYRTRWAQVNATSPDVARPGISGLESIEDPDCGSPGDNTFLLQEMATFNIALANMGDLAAQNLTVTATTPDGVIFDWVENPITVANLAGNSTGEVTFSGRLIAANSCPENTTITFEIELGGDSFGTRTFDAVLMAQPVITTGFDDVVVSGQPNGFTSKADANIDDWAIIPDPFQFQPTDVWFSADVEGNTDRSLLTPWFEVQDGNTVVTFDIAYDYEVAFDGAVIELRLEGGDWMDIGGTATGAPYDGPLSQTTPLGSRPAWNGNQSTYRTCTIDLGNTYNGQSAQIRWRSVCDALSVGVTPTPGIALDNFGITNVTWISDFTCDETACCFATIEDGIAIVLQSLGNGEWPGQQTVLDYVRTLNNVCPMPAR